MINFHQNESFMITIGSDVIASLCQKQFESSNNFYLHQ